MRAATNQLAEDLAKLEALGHPATDQEILKTLAALAALFQVAVPDQDGLELYVAALRKLPRPALREARDWLVLHHKWPRLPYPADFIEAGKDSADRLALYTKVVRQMRAKCFRALTMLR